MFCIALFKQKSIAFATELVPSADFKKFGWLSIFLGWYPN